MPRCNLFDMLVQFTLHRGSRYLHQVTMGNVFWMIGGLIHVAKNEPYQPELLWPALIAITNQFYKFHHCSRQPGAFSCRKQFRKAQNSLSLA